MERSAFGSRAVILAACIAAAAIASAISPDTRGAVRVLIETVVVDGLGTNTVAEDEADLFAGQSGVLEKSITLKARAGSAYPREEVEVTTRVSLGDGGDSYCPLMLSIVATGAPFGGPAPTPSDAERKAFSMSLEPGEVQMTPAYVSPWTGGRIVLRVTCGEPRPAAAMEAPSTMVFDVALERGEDDGLPELLRSDRLSTTLGGEVGSLFSSNRPLPDSEEGERRYRRDRIEVRVAPLILSGGRLQVEVRLQGEVATISASGTDARHPIDVVETLVLANGETGDIGVTITAATGEAGWTRVNYLLRVTGRF